MRVYAKTGRQRLHTPGHKGCLDWGNIAELDITELGIDGKVFPADLIVKAQKKVADYFGSKEARLLVGGSSMGLKASIMTVDGDCIVSADSHRAVFEGLELARRKAIVVPNIKREGLSLPLTAEQIEQASKANPTAKAVIVMSPTYFGIATDTPDRVAKVTHSNGLKLIADSAHGAHFPTSDIFPKSFSKVADYTVLSGHKTLDTLTQGAYLCINDASAVDKVDHNLRLLGTTSPSYLILASLEYGVEKAQKADTKNVLLAVDKFKQEFLSYYKVNDCFVTVSDPFRLVVDAQAMGKTGYELEASERKRGIECELATERFVVYIFTFADGIKK